MTLRLVLVWFIHVFPIVAAPLCPTPPVAPAGGSVVNNPLALPLAAVKTCALAGGLISMQCHSFLSLYVRAAAGGRVQAAAYSPYCVTSSPLLPGCSDLSVVAIFRAACHGQVGTSTHT
jgi:hypothetical protein